MHYSDARQLIRKCRLLHGLFAGLDVYLFPKQISAHASGTKASGSLAITGSSDTLCQQTVAVSHLDSSYVLTGGYDQVLRIWDTSNGRCLAQVWAECCGRVQLSCAVFWSRFDHHLVLVQRR